MVTYFLIVTKVLADNMDQAFWISASEDLKFDFLKLCEVECMVG